MGSGASRHRTPELLETRNGTIVSTGINKQPGEEGSTYCRMNCNQ